MGLEALQALSRADVELDGIIYTVRPPRLQDCIASGDIPFPVLDELARAEKERDAAAGDVPMAEVIHSYEMNDSYVRLSVLAINGEPLELTLDDVKDIPASHYAELLAIARRVKPLPGKD